MRTAISLLVVMLLATSSLVIAGTQYLVTCTDERCGFTADISLGGGRLFDQASGYCQACAKVVSVTWKRDQSRKGFLSIVFDPNSGERHSLFKCPTCSKAFIEVREIEAFRHCPKCGKKSLQTKRTLLFD